MSSSNNGDAKLPGVIRAILNLRATVRHHLENLDYLSNQLSRLNEIIEENLPLNETFDNHLANLGKSASVDQTELSYSFEHTSRILKPKIYQNSTKRNTAVCTVALGEDYCQKIQPCLNSQRLYCESKGYDYAMLTLEPTAMDREPTWYKIPLVYKLIHLGYKNICYIDADAMITNPQISMQPFFETLIDEKKVISVAEDEGGINMGVFFINNSSDSIRLLDLIWNSNVGKHRMHMEQNSFKHLLNNYAQIRKLLSISPSAKAFNSFPQEREVIYKTRQENNWTPDDFICHFSGISGSERSKLIGLYLAKNKASSR